ncbi:MULTISPECIES: thiamine diphosphokinase [unclassified Sedimentibacter]|uniref:thiamine diphosphokinase n=1 Tax=unclassified Sedimentibacter TaxID=2649220 RepID=UPI0027DFA161|nr:thiamine diphosphokinase [Sedimentibacter sp. MB35-C1]WMJ76082.1 thiamine diphosphokinase [Sedimentibacter sp. MB35-C1]
MSVLIIGNGNDVEKNRLEKFDINFVICADGGLEKAEKLGIVPDIILGDFDSVDAAVLEKYRQMKIETVTFPSEKDYTDMELSIENAVKKGFNHVVMAGVTGTRLDHTLANIQLLERYHNRGVDIEIIDNNNHIKIITGSADIKIKYEKDCYVSLVPVTERIEGLTLRGFKYPLDNVIVERGTAFLVSNEIIKDEGRIILNKGTALVFVSKD